MRSKALLTWFVWTAVVALSINVAWLATGRWPTATVVDSVREFPLAEGPLTITPYTLFIEDVRQFSPLGQASGTTLIRAARSDGSQLSRIDVLNRRAPVSSRYIVFATGLVVSTDDVREEKTVRATTGDVRRQHRDPATDCLRSFVGEPFAEDEKVIGREKLLGYDVLVIGRLRGTTRWLAPGLTCAQLRRRGTHTSGEPLEQIVTRVQTGEPPAELFDLPARYSEVPRIRPGALPGTK